MTKILKRWPVILIVSGIFLIGVFVVGSRFDSQSIQQQAQVTAANSTQTLITTPTPAPWPTGTAVPLLPTQTATTLPAADPQPTSANGLLTKTPTPTGSSCSADFCIPRAGVSGRMDVVSAAFNAGLPFGHYFDWELVVSPIPAGTATFWQMIRVSEDGIRNDWDEMAQVIEANPGTNWIVGNEPDILWQDNTTAERYAELYHDAYHYIKERDPSAMIAVAGVGQPTPMRLAYLDTVLATYQEKYGQSMPVDIWTIHNFILREERDSWGVGIPPGMTDESGAPLEQGILYEIADHNDLTIFEQNLFYFRQWMAERGYRERPLAVTEFGILMPSDFGFPPPVVADFLTGSFDILLQASDDEFGYPADDNRLVQWAFWYSVYDPLEFPTGNLYDPETDMLTDLGQIYVEYIHGD